MSKNKDEKAKGAVLEYLTQQNRPYSAIDVFNNLHKEYGKTAVVKVLETLAQEGKIKEKTYGKQKVYLPDQSQYPTCDETELKAMDLKIAQMTEELKVLQEETRKMENELRGLNSSLSTDEAKKQLTVLRGEVENYKKKLAQLKEGGKAISPEEREVIIKNRVKLVKEWRKRKRTSTDILNAILEGYPKTKKQLYEDVGIETDEEYKVTPPEI
ncbi:homologous-pairing protein 2 homolog [Lingula anatina]|uniref:Homologous-pairing protein 2 homolog n=1 Tax=Lingula anatina TaxID=7574 RepID=A0A1S3KG13_LINAN|nr:homologous-pairing protein 2 homolog [Lingula anatina]|eukprot:XP_013421171.1 homologous-pairing protein 2 homolog [Lingula anatina]